MGACARLKMNGVRYQFLSFTPRQVLLLADNSNSVITGSPNPHADNKAPSVEISGFDVLMEPSVDEWETLLPLILSDGEEDTAGGTGPSYVLDHFRNVSFTTYVDYCSAVHRWDGCKVNAAVISGQKGNDILRLLLQVYATKEVLEEDSVDFGGRPFGKGYVFTSGGINLQGSNRLFERVELQISRNLYRDFNNSVYATCIQSSGNLVQLSTSVNYTAGNDTAPNNTLLYWNEKEGTYNSGWLSFVRGSRSMEFRFGELASPAAPPPISGRDTPIKLPIRYQAYETEDSPMLAVYLEDTEG